MILLLGAVGSKNPTPLICSSEIKFRHPSFVHQKLNSDTPHLFIRIDLPLDDMVFLFYFANTMATFARKDIVKQEEISTYHLYNRCVRKAFLCGIDKDTGIDYEHRRSWIFDRVKFVSDIFLIETGSISVMNNHFHLTARIRPDLAKALSDDDIIERWWKLYPRKIKGKYEATPPPELIEKWKNDTEWLEETRKRLYSVSWFMKVIEEPIALRANKEDAVKGRFWEGRFQSQLLLDEQAVLTASIYVDLNPIKAGMVNDLKDSDFTSIQQRIINENGPKEKKIEHPGSFLAPFKSCINSLQEEAPFLLIEEKDYIDLCYWYADQHKGKDTLKSSKNFNNWIHNLADIDQVMKSCSYAVGTYQKMKERAQETGKKWLKGSGILKSMPT